MYKRILVPLDGSKLAEQVLPYVKVIGKLPGSRIELFRAVESSPRDLEDPKHGVYSHSTASGIQSRVEAWLETIAQPMRQEGLTVTCTAIVGDPAHCIVDEAKKEPSSLIAMTTHGRTGLARWMLGSVTDKVLRTAVNPLLIIRSQDHEADTPEIALKEVIVPLDGSQVAEQVLDNVTPIAVALGLVVTMVRVIPPEGYYFGYMDYAARYYGDVAPAEDATHQAATYLSKVAEPVREAGVAEVRELLLRGNPATAIIDLAQATPDNLVAMTTHGRSGVRRWLLGSVTDRVVRHSGDPVLVIRA